MATSSSHAVQFYESEDFLRSCVGDFLSKGVVAGDPLIVIATEKHRDAFADELRSRGLEVDPSRAQFIDARQALSRFMVDAMPDPTLFEASIGSVIRDASRESRQIRAYGEMVDLLWRDGNAEAAIRLEELWNDLARNHSFDLLCAYPMGNFIKASVAEQFNAICDEHTHVTPAESVTTADDEQRAREIARLQQRAAALADEVEHRKELERALRKALAARRAAEEQLRQSERELQDFVENATVCLHWVGHDGTILWANDAELKLLGYTRDEYIGSNIAEFHADQNALRDILTRLSANEEIHDYETRLRAKDGSVVDVAISSNVWFENDKFIHTRCFTHNITERKRQERANEFLLDVTAALNTPSPIEERLQQAANLVAPRVAAACVIDLAADRELGRFVTAGAESVVATGNGSRVVVPMKVGDRSVGTITLIAPADKDNETVVSEFARRTAIAIDNAVHLRAAQQANQAKDQFLATLSHELRTPLTAILGWSRMLTLGGLDEETTRLAHETIERSAKTQAAIIDDLLDLSRVVTGKLTLNRDLVDLAVVVENAVQTLNLAAAAKNIHVEARNDAKNARVVVYGDATRLQQIVWNLISNAVKFSDHGAQVTVTLEHNGNAARITVRDNGHGIPSDFLPYVFEPFRQADSASTRVHNGLGLGLAIVKYLTEAHGGRVVAKSEGTGKGATFVVTLPLANRRTETVAPPQEVDVVDLTNTTVLVVDDDDDTRQLLSAILRRCGAQVHLAESVDKARLMLAAIKPTTVISDIAMPEFDGFDLLSFIRSQSASAAQLPIIALTASGDPNSEQRIRDFGFDAYVSKPVDPLHLARVVAGFQRA